MKKFLLMGVLMLAVVVALGATSLAYAQTPTPGDSAPSGSTTKPVPFIGETTGRGPGPGKHGPGGFEHGVLDEYLQPALADAFGVTVEELDALQTDGKTLQDLAIKQDLTVAEFEAKLESAHQQALDQAVVAGAITQEQADAIIQHLADRQAGPDRNQAPGAGESTLHTYMQAALAESFGLTVEALQTMQADGKSLKDLAIEQNLTVAEFQSKLDSARQSALEQAVADGAITQSEADWISAHPHHGPGGRHGGKPGCEPGAGGRSFSNQVTPAQP